MNILEKAIKLVDFWYDTDPYNFRNNFTGIENAIKEAKDCIEKDLERTIDIIRQDIDKIEEEDFTEQVENIINVLTS